MIGIPKGIRKLIQKDLIKRSRRGEEGWRFANQDEDTLLGDYLGNLRMDNRTLDIKNIRYKWEIVYHKIRGRGPFAYEKKTGADAIISFKVKDNNSGDYSIKSILIQAKKGQSISGLDFQKEKMNLIAPDGNFILRFTEEGYFIQENKRADFENVGKFIADQFIECNVGVEKLEYDEVKNILRVGNTYIKNANLSEVVVDVEFENK